MKKVLAAAIEILCNYHVDSARDLKEDNIIPIDGILKFLNDNLGAKNESYASLLEIVNSSDQSKVVIYAIFGCYSDHLGAKSAEILLLDTGDFEGIDKIINAKISLLTKISMMTPQEENKENFNVVKMSLIFGFIAHTNELLRLAIKRVQSDEEKKRSSSLLKITESSVNGILEILKLNTEKGYEKVEKTPFFPSDALLMVLSSSGENHREISYYQSKNTKTISYRVSVQLTNLLTNLNELLLQNLCKDSIPKLKAGNFTLDFLLNLSKTICNEVSKKERDKLEKAINTLIESIKSLENNAWEKARNLSLEEAKGIQVRRRIVGNSIAKKSIANGSESNKIREKTAQVTHFKQDLFSCNLNSTENKASTSIATKSVSNNSEDAHIFNKISTIVTNATLSFEEKISKLQKILTNVVKECLVEQKNNYENYWLVNAQKFEGLYLKIISDFKKEEEKAKSFTRLFEETKEKSLLESLEEEITFPQLLKEEEIRYEELLKCKDEKPIEEKLFYEMQSINMKIIRIEDFRSYCLSDEGSGNCTEFLVKIIENSSSLLNLLRIDDVANFVADNNRKVEAILFLESLSNNLVSSSEAIESVKACQSMKNSLRDVKSMGDLQLVNFTRSVISSLSFKKSSELKNSKLKLIYSIVDAFERVVFLKVESLLKNFPVSTDAINNIASKLIKGFDAKDEHENYKRILEWMRKIQNNIPLVLMLIEDLEIFYKVKSTLSIIDELKKACESFATEYRQVINKAANFSDAIKNFLIMREKRNPQFVLLLRKDLPSGLSNFLKSIQPSKEIIKMSFDDPVKRSVIPLKDNQLRALYKVIISEVLLHHYSEFQTDYFNDILEKVISESIDLNEELLNHIKDSLDLEVFHNFLRIVCKDFLNELLNSELEKMRLKSAVKIEDIKEYLSYEIFKKIFLFLVIKENLDVKTSEREFYEKYTYIGDAFDSLSQCLKKHGIDFSHSKLRKMCKNFVGAKDDHSVYSEANKLRDSVVKAIKNRHIDNISSGTSVEVLATHIMSKYDKTIMSGSTFNLNIEGRILCYCLSKELKRDVSISLIERNKGAIHSINSFKKEMTEECLKKFLMPQYLETFSGKEEVRAFNFDDSKGADILLSIVSVEEEKFNPILLPNSTIKMPLPSYIIKNVAQEPLRNCNNVFSNKL